MEWITIFTTAGTYRASSHLMAHRNLLKVKRDGRGYDIVTVNPGFPVPPAAGTRQVSYTPGLGALDFPEDIMFNAGEKVYALVD
jgi:hypothetical protein